MPAGQYNSRITLQKANQTLDRLGATVSGYVDFATVWADIRHISGLESIKTDTVTSKVKASVRIRYRTGIVPSMRVLHGVDVYDVVAVLPDVQHKKYVDLSCVRLD